MRIFCLIFTLGIILLYPTRDSLAQLPHPYWQYNDSGYFFHDQHHIYYNAFKEKRTDNDSLLHKKEPLTNAKHNPIDSLLIFDIADLTPQINTADFKIYALRFFDKDSKILIFANAEKVWRYKTKGDFFIYDRNRKTLRQLGKNYKKSALQFAQISPDNQKVAYVYENNIYIEYLRDTTGKTIQVTKDGSPKLFNGIFDWSYEEEFSMLNGLRWSANSNILSFWQIDSKNIDNFLMINNTDSIYPHIIPIPYPKVGFPIAKAKIGYYNLSTKKKYWIKIPTQPSEDYYITQLEPYPQKEKFIFQILNRAQQKSKIYSFNCPTQKTELLYSETNQAWIGVPNLNNHNKTWNTWPWIDNKGTFLWISEKDAYRRLYTIKYNTEQVALTPDTYDVINVEFIDTLNKEVFFMASPENATQRYLYKINYEKPNASAERVTPPYYVGTNSYEFSLTGQRAKHYYSNHLVAPIQHFITTAHHQSNHFNTQKIQEYIDSATKNSPFKNIRFSKVNTPDGTTLDAWIHTPKDFDSTKKYPVLFYVYGEPASQTVRDAYSSPFPFLYLKDKYPQDFIYVALDNRGSPAPKGNAWRKAIYKHLGRVNVQDQADGAKAFLAAHPYTDTSRVGVWGWSGGGSVTLHLLFQHPEIYKMGISIAPLTDLYTYDNIYEERYMGVPENKNDSNYILGSPITYAKNLQGKLLLIHGTNDDNVHYQNAELLINELIKHNKLFYFMSYPNRTHSISEGVGTRTHLKTIFTNFVRQSLF